MSWATEYIEMLKRGEIVQFRPRGKSMTGRIESGQLVTVEPAVESSIEKGDIVLCRVGRAQYLHIVKAIQGKRYQIGNNRGRINGWIMFDQIFGRCCKIEK